MKSAQRRPPRSVPGEDKPHRRGYIQNRLQNFGLTMIVMGASFVLYYLGLFGGVAGPLQPERIGDKLAVLGFSNRHLLFICLSFMVIAITWNWMYNAINRFLGRDMTCAVPGEGEPGFCARPVRREMGGRAAGRYVCAAGHQSLKAHFHIVKKGTVSHFLWMMFLVFSAIVFHLS